MPIKDADYRAAQVILVEAGCCSAADIGPENPGESHADDLGQRLVDTCSDEFRDADQDRPDLFGPARMTRPHYDAIVTAKKRLGLR